MPAELPKNSRAWSLGVKKHGIQNHTIFTIDGATTIESASKISIKQHLMLRTLQSKIYNPLFIPLVPLGLAQYHTAASKWLEEFPPYQRYLASIEKTKDITPLTDSDEFDLGLFEIPRAQQLQVLNLLGGQGGALKLYEETVNGALISFLSALSLKHPDRRGSEWVPTRLPFKVKFGKVEYEARIDGYFGNIQTSSILVIVEAKAGNRENHETQVSRQEDAEIVAWIMANDIPPQNPTWLVSQDGKELYLTHVSFSDRCKTYLRTGTPTNPQNPNDFLRIKRYGPWKLDDWREIDEFAKAVLAIMLQVATLGPGEVTELDQNRQIDPQINPHLADGNANMTTPQNGKPFALGYLDQGKTYILLRGRLFDLPPSGTEGLDPHAEVITVLSRQGGRLVLQHDSDYISKSGTAIRKSESEAMKLVAKHTSIPVPRVIYAQFLAGDNITSPNPSGNNIGMTIIPGAPLDKSWNSLDDETKQSVCNQTWNLIAKLQTIPRPAHLDGLFQGLADGSPTEDALLEDLNQPPQPLRTDDDLRARIYQRYLHCGGLKYKDELLTMLPQSSASVFTHADIAPRNIMVDERHGITGILDWEWAGWYPDYWEYAQIMRPACRLGDWQEWMDRTAPQRWDIAGITAARRVLF
ncbi:hypothetical protein FQN52_001482 [Onygenales sp. PD_12]|nr:hypothetical protein FQN52_001482 [Onygenales sp. PD_12]